MIVIGYSRPETGKEEKDGRPGAANAGQGMQHVKMPHENWSVASMRSSWVDTWCVCSGNGSLESLDALLVHIDWEGDVKLHAPRPLHETLVVQKLSSWWMVVQSNGVPSVTSIADTHAIPE